MNKEEFDELIKTKETLRVEFKKSSWLHDTHTRKRNIEIAIQLVAFANRNGGYIVIGINPDGTYEGAHIDEDKEALKIFTADGYPVYHSAVYRLKYLANMERLKLKFG